MMTSTLCSTPATTGLSELDALCVWEPGTLNLFAAAEGCGLTGAAYAAALATAARTAEQDPQARVLLITARPSGRVRQDLELYSRNAHLAANLLVGQATTVAELMGVFLRTRGATTSLPVVLVADLHLMTSDLASVGAATHVLQRTVAASGACVFAYAQTRTLPDRLRYFTAGDDETQFNAGWDVCTDDLRLPTPYDVRGSADLQSVSTNIVVLHRSRVRNNPTAAGHLADTRAYAVLWKTRRGATTPFVELRFDVNPHGRGGRYLNR